MRILVLNLGSSSIKFQLFNMDKRMVLAKGLVEQIGEKEGRISISTSAKAFQSESLHITDHAHGLLKMQEKLQAMGVLKSLDYIDGVGHRVVQGGDLFIKPTLITPEVIGHLEDLCPLAPLHNPAHLAGIKAMQKQVPNLPQVAVFDTAYHQSIPPHAFMYALPYELYQQHKLRRYGFHGTSHNFVAQEAARFLHIPYRNFNAISLHLGNGASVCAIKDGKSVETSMGLTPLEGLVMGTRSGDLDPALLGYIGQLTNKDTAGVVHMLNHESGLRGLCGDNDMRSIEKRMANKDEKAKLAFDIYTHRIRKYIGAYAFVLGALDAIIFTAGVGENSAKVRHAVCSGLENFGIFLDEEANANPRPGIALLSQARKLPILRVPTNEELAIAKATVQVVKGL
ncbi:acetate kinase [Helicobacter heilmannii]|uniref:Acetate kinase n=1 Tax=Helicobacter heilmannii TaxID=35817 RepID=A0A0K2XIV3_HELHE|nr:acetate kinase [Helicobacter heilmannii]CCM11794.1 Acetate kinase [Helicobacter heilmannii ASB1.4]CRF46017.1 Acetate kinase [Helicobacter heilmannii]CRF49618.1 Acetate kinase [Helicobacter heilmannii]CRF50368.1 Acetate kinase [Helicobacter heilmannii]CRI33935.1 Acetate kinase [Helicobacter heilmannii]